MQFLVPATRSAPILWRNRQLSQHTLLSGGSFEVSVNITGIRGVEVLDLLEYYIAVTHLFHSINAQWRSQGQEVCGILTSLTATLKPR